MKEDLILTIPAWVFRFGLALAVPLLVFGSILWIQWIMRGQK